MANCPRLSHKQMNCIVTHLSGRSLCTSTVSPPSRTAVLLGMPSDPLHSGTPELVQLCVTDDPVSLNLRGPFWGGEAIFTSVDQMPRVLGRVSTRVQDCDGNGLVSRRTRFAEATCQMKRPCSTIPNSNGSAFIPSSSDEGCLSLVPLDAARDLRLCTSPRLPAREAHQSL